MIDTQTARSRSTRRLWAGTIQTMFQTMGLQDRAAAMDLSESLAVFCEQHPHMPGHTLSLLMARSFCATGDRAAASQILQQDQTHRVHADSWIEVLAATDSFPELYPFFSARILRPLRLKTVSDARIWVLDLEKINLSAADRYELILLKMLRVLTEKVSTVWNKTAGQGTFVIKGFAHLTQGVLPQDALSASQLLTYIQDVLARCGEQNGWSSTPSVLLLDL